MTTAYAYIFKVLESMPGFPDDSSPHKFFDPDNFTEHIEPLALSQAASTYEDACIRVRVSASARRRSLIETQCAGLGRYLEARYLKMFN